MNASPQVMEERRAFLRSGGALLVGLSLGACATGDRAASGHGRAAADRRTPVAGPPDAALLDTWLAIHEDNTATLYLGFAELGQGATTALLQVAERVRDMLRKVVEVL